MPTTRPTFKEAFCSCTQCPPELFSARVLALTFYRHASPFLGFFKHCLPSAVAPDKHLIETVGSTKSITELRAELARFRHDQRRQGLLRGFFRCRLSGRKLLELARLAWSNPRLASATNHRTRSAAERHTRLAA